MNSIRTRADLGLLVLRLATGIVFLMHGYQKVFTYGFAGVGDAFAGLVIPVVESAADALIAGELSRVRRCADARCLRVFYDTTKNGRRRWCDMSTFGNRAKAARHREKVRTGDLPGPEASTLQT